MDLLDGEDRQHGSGGRTRRGDQTVGAAHDRRHQPERCGAKYAGQGTVGRIGTA
ncbi:hypothetical protein ACFS07_14775 [Undibacterium arcticum]